MLKHSVQRDSILNFLSARHDHPTAETIYLGVRQELPNISLATVYRNLTLLDDIGLIQRIRTGNGPDRFDGHPEPHNHFICRECGKVIDLAKRAKALNLDAIHDTVHEMARDEARHGKALTGLLKRYFG